MSLIPALTKLYTHMLGVATLLLGAGCMSMPYVAIDNEAVFRSRVVDRSLSWPGGFDVRFTADGRITGRFPGGPVVGTWRWQDGRFCRTISVGGNARNPECLGIELSSTQVRFRRESGGYFLPYRIGD